jgi:hypothetical protein
MLKVFQLYARESICYFLIVRKHKGPETSPACERARLRSEIRAADVGHVDVLANRPVQDAQVFLGDVRLPGEHLVM